MLPKFIDTHCHFDPEDVASDLIQEATAARVGVLAVGGNAINNQTAQASGVPFACGYDWSCTGASIQLTLHPQMVAVGELGFDFHRGYSLEIEADQRERFALQAEFARRAELPIIVHTREADEVTLSALREADLPKTGVIHSFTGDREIARRLLNLGYFISFSGIVTFRNADLLRETARYVPDDRILIETDAPYLAPVPFRGRRNRPAYVRETAQFVAALRGMTVEAFAQLTNENTIRCFGKQAVWETL
ncbi:MAG: TatD family hydrolase [Kiritimatiellae bacterium]|nr:TatD family hydrolase [Kiritimatiellia bacterium]